VNLDTEGVSREHALIEFDGLGVWLTDLDSVNGSGVNGKPVKGKQRVRDGDLLEFAGVKLRVEVVRRNE
jgi:pSer/pThr/pTyr-binding forkhead associated (FHA) protein